MCYAVGVNRTGTDYNQLDYVGHTQVVDYLGNYLLEPQESDGVYILTLDKAKMQETREKLAFLDDQDAFKLQ
jgi:predicted amidohydrolase